MYGTKNMLKVTGRKYILVLGGIANRELKRVANKNFLDWIYSSRYRYCSFHVFSLRSDWLTTDSRHFFNQ